MRAELTMELPSVFDPLDPSIFLVGHADRRRYDSVSMRTRIVVAPTHSGFCASPPVAVLVTRLPPPQEREHGKRCSPRFDVISRQEQILLCAKAMTSSTEHQKMTSFLQTVRLCIFPRDQLQSVFTNQKLESLEDRYGGESL